MIGIRRLSAQDVRASHDFVFVRCLPRIVHHNWAFDVLREHLHFVQARFEHVFKHCPLPILEAANRLALPLVPPKAVDTGEFDVCRIFLLAAMATMATTASRSSVNFRIDGRTIKSLMAKATAWKRVDTSVLRGPWGSNA